MHDVLRQDLQFEELADEADVSKGSLLDGEDFRFKFVLGLFFFLGLEKKSEEEV